MSRRRRTRAEMRASKSGAVEPPRVGVGVGAAPAAVGAVGAVAAVAAAGAAVDAGVGAEVSGATRAIASARGTGSSRTSSPSTVSPKS